MAMSTSSTSPTPDLDPTDAAAIPTITGVAHIDLTVSDLDRSELWYAELFGLQRVLDGRNDEHHFASRYLIHPDTLLVVGLVVHDADGDRSPGEPVRFDEHHIGLDHLSLNVASPEELQAWARRLDALGIDHSPISSGEMWDVLVFRDPDNIQLELFHLKPAAAALLTG